MAISISQFGTPTAPVPTSDLAVLAIADKSFNLPVLVRKFDAMQRRLPPLNSLRAFEAAARLGSFSRAAEELHVTHGAISRHVQLLEEWLGAPMFRRFNRRVLLTEGGRAYLDEIGAAFDRIERATAQYATRGRTRLLRVNATATLTLRWLIPRLSSFQLGNPAIEVRLTTSNEPIETIEEPFDVIIRRRADDLPGYLVIAYLPEYRIPVCSPKLLASNPLRRPQDLERHTLLHPASQPGIWGDWLKAAAVPDLQPKQSLVFEHNYQALQGALDGLGVANGSSSLIADDLAAGRLIMPFSAPRLPGVGYRAYVPETKVGELGVVAFRDWFRQLSGASGVKEDGSA
jgi:LysR family transcriptional regulator, glycine cleavage system transcriptional activator